MMAKLNGSPVINRDGVRQISRVKSRSPLPREFVNPAIRTVPTIDVLTQVRMNKAMFSQGNFCSGACSNKISAGGLNVLSMKRLVLLLQRLQVFAWLEAHGFSWRDIHFRAGTRVPSDSRLPRLYREDAKATQLNPIVGLEGVFHAIEDGVHRLLCFRLADSRPIYDLIDKIEFDH